MFPSFIFQQAHRLGDRQFHLPDPERFPFNGITWNGHQIHFPTPEVLDNRGRVVRVSGWYQADNPQQGTPSQEVNNG